MVPEFHEVCQKNNPPAEVILLVDVVANLGNPGNFYCGTYGVSIHSNNQ